MGKDIVTKRILMNTRFWRIVDTIDDVLRREYFGQQVRVQFCMKPQLSGDIIEDLKKHYLDLGFNIEIQIHSTGEDDIATHVILN